MNWRGAFLELEGVLYLIWRAYSTMELLEGCFI